MIDSNQRNLNAVSGALKARGYKRLKHDIFILPIDDGWSFLSSPSSRYDRIDLRVGVTSRTFAAANAWMTPKVPTLRDCDTRLPQPIYILPVDHISSTLARKEVLAIFSDPVETSAVGHFMDSIVHPYLAAAADFPRCLARLEERFRNLPSFPFSKLTILRILERMTEFDSFSVAWLSDAYATSPVLGAAYADLVSRLRTWDNSGNVSTR